MLYIEQSPAIILPKKRPLLRKILRGSDYEHHKERDLNSHRGKRGFQIWFFNWQNEVIRKDFYDEESDVIEAFIEIHKQPYKFPTTEEVAHVQLFITQSLTTGAGGQQNFSVPVTWGPNTSSCIAGGGNGSIGQLPGPTVNGGAGGGGGAFASTNIQALTRGSTAPYLIGASAQVTWFSNPSLLIADAGVSAVNTNVSPRGGLASNSVGTVTRNGGNGGAGGILASGTGSPSGGGGGGAGGPTSAGSNGAAGTTSAGANPVASGAGGNSDTASGGASTNGAPNNGGNGTDFDSSHGAGAGASGGGLALANSGPAFAGGAGGNYGGGAGGSSNRGSANMGASVAGTQGMIFLSWVPYQYTEIYSTS